MPWVILNQGKPDYLPDVIWQKLQADVSGWKAWYWAGAHNLLFGQGAQQLFKLLGRKPDKLQVAEGYVQWQPDDYINWFETHCWIHALYIAQDRHSEYHKIKHELSSVAEQAEKLAATLASLYQLTGGLSGVTDILPLEVKRLSALYQRAVHVNNERGGNAQSVEVLAGLPDYFDEALPDDVAKARELREKIAMHDESQNIPLLSDLLNAAAESTRQHIQRFEAQGEHAFTIDGYKPESLPARYIALFDKGVETGEYHAVKEKAPRVSHAAMSLQCSLVFAEDIPKDRVIDIRKRAASAK